MPLTRVQFNTLNRLISSCETLYSRLNRETREIDAWIEDFPEIRRLIGVTNELDARLRECRESLERRRPPLAAEKAPNATQMLLTDAFQSIFGSSAPMSSPVANVPAPVAVAAVKTAAVAPPAPVANPKSKNAKSLEDLEVHCRTVFPVDAFSVAEVLQFLGFNAKTGTVKVHCDEEILVVELQNGDLIHAYSTNSPAGYRLGEILVQQGALSSEALRDLLAKSRGQSRRLGRLLSDARIVAPEAVWAALRYQVEQLFRRAMTSRIRVMEFISRPVSSDDAAMAFNLTAMLLEGASQGDKPR